MAETEPMTVDERHKCLHKVRLRCWVDPPKKERSRLLDEARAIPGVHRKSLMRLLQGELAGKRRTRQRGKMRVRRWLRSSTWAAERKIATPLGWRPSVIRTFQRGMLTPLIKG